MSLLLVFDCLNCGCIGCYLFDGWFVFNLLSCVFTAGFVVWFGFGQCFLVGVSLG